MTRCLLVLTACCFVGCIAKSDGSNSSNSTTGDASNQNEPLSKEPQVVHTTQTDVERVPVENEIEVISFNELNLAMQPDMRFRPFLLQDRAVKELIGKRVNIAGYILPSDRMQGMTDFILLKNLQCKFGPGGQADHLVHVYMQGDASTDFTDKIVYVEGILELNPVHSPDEVSTWSIYDLKAVRASKTPPSRRR